MSYPVKMEQVYCHILRGSPFIFSDERCKKKLLDLIFERCFCREWHLYAFCVTDSDAYFLSVTDRPSYYREKVQRAISEFMHWNAGTQGIWRGEDPMLRLEEIQKEVTIDELIHCCCAIHSIPIECNYVQHVQDYWWSSYITYLGSFEWHTICTQKVLAHISEDEELALNRMRKIQSSFESPTLYITHIFSKNDAENKKISSL